MTQRKCSACGLEKKLEVDYYFNGFFNRYETQCKECRRHKINKQRRDNYDPKKQRERHLRMKATGRFKGQWKKFKEKYPEKYKARYTLQNAVRCGKVKKGKCEVNNSECNGQIQGHHDDYTKPLQVRWLCRKHHVEHHYHQLSTESITS